jgi:hypothetical protein
MSNELRGLSIKVLQIVRTIEGILYLLPALGCFAGILWLSSRFGLNIITGALDIILVAQGITLAAKASEKFASMPEAPPPEDRRRYLGNPVRMRERGIPKEYRREY